MTEDFLSWVWKHQQFNIIGARTTEGELVVVHNPGQLNTDSGPDYFNARIIIGDTEWVGNVELHVKSSEWYQHHHEIDTAYDNVILHVVYKNDVLVKNSAGRELLVFDLSNYIYNNAFDDYKNLISDICVIACKQQLKNISNLNISNWIDRLLVERLEQKINRVKHLQKLGYNLTTEVLYHLLARNFGFGVNGDPFSMLANSIPLSVVIKHANSPFQIEALLFGQSGLIPKGCTDPYPKQLFEEYKHLSIKYRLKPLEKKVWKFMRMRPVNFPTIRITQFASLLTKIHELHNTLIYCDDFGKIKSILDVNVSPYWYSRYTFGVKSVDCNKRLGANSIFNIIINSISPYLFWIGKTCGDDLQVEKAIKYINRCPPEHNRITRLWNKTPVTASNGGDTQSLYHLVTEYCSQKKCLNCAWGTEILLKK